jgi:hypothetical protein
MSWLILECGTPVNLDHIVHASIIEVSHMIILHNDHRVILFPEADNDDLYFIACQGSRSKCEDYLQAFLEFVGGKQICAVGQHRCGCVCGCDEMIRDDFEVCDECQAELHKFELVWNGVKTKAA